MLLLLGCTNQNLNRQDQVEKSQLYSIAHDSFYHEYSVALSDFSQILSLATQSPSDDELFYLKGRIDGYLSHGTFQSSLIKNIDKKYIDIIIHPSLQKPTFKLISDLSDYLKKFEDNVINENNFMELANIKNDLLKLSELAQDINVDSHVLKESEFRNKYLNSIRSMQKIMYETKW